MLFFLGVKGVKEVKGVKGVKPNAFFLGVKAEANG